MSADRRKRHHYVPKFLQKHFCDADGMLWYGIRDSQEVKKVSPRDAFVKRGLYTSYEEAHEQLDHITYEPDDRYEREFSELENRAAPAIEKLIAGTRRLQDTDSKDLLRSMSSGEVTACKELIVSSTTRTPDSMKATIVRSRHELGEAISKLDLGPLRRFPEEVQGTFLRRIERSAMAHVASSSHNHAEGGFDADKSGLAVAAYSSSNSRFILGSCGVAHLPIAGDPENLDGTWLPISPNHAIALDNDPGTIVCYREWEGLCSRINQALARDSKLIAGDSKSLVESMLQRR